MSARWTIRTPDGSALIGLFATKADATHTLKVALHDRGTVIKFPHATTWAPDPTVVISNHHTTTGGSRP